MEKNRIKTAVLSYGMSGKLFHCPFIFEHDGFELFALVERSKKTAALKYPGLKSYDSIEAVMENDEIELVVVNTPNATHFEFAKLALQSGKNVLVEKAFTVTSEEAKQLYEITRKNNCQIFPYQNRRYDSDFLSVKSIVDSGKLGNIVECHIRFDRYKYEIGPKLAKETKVPGSGISYDLGPHIIDMAIAIFGIPLQWSKTLGNFRPNTQVDDYVNMQFQYANGLQIFLTASLLVADVQPAFILNGTKGSFTKSRTNVQEEQLQAGMSPGNPAYGIEPLEELGTLTTIAADGSKTQERIISPNGSYMRLFDDVYQSIRFEKLYPITEDQIIKQLEILEG